MMTRTSGTDVYTLSCHVPCASSHGTERSGCLGYPWSAPSCWFPRRSVVAPAIHSASTSTRPAHHCVRPVGTTSTRMKLVRLYGSRGLHLLFGEPCGLDLHFSIWPARPRLHAQPSIQKTSTERQSCLLKERYQVAPCPCHHGIALTFDALSDYHLQSRHRLGGR
jgi:hypothetical protein